MKIFVTKWALTKGIVTYDAKATNDPKLVKVQRAHRGQAGLWVDLYFRGPEWHSTPEAAAIRAEKLRSKKIKSLIEQIKKLEELKFAETLL